MPSYFVRRYLKDATVPVIELKEELGFTTPVTSDGFCFLLDRTTKKCTKHTKRPPICNLYGKALGMECPYVDRQGRTRPEEQVQIIRARQKLGSDIVTSLKLQENERKPFWIH